MPRAFAYQWSQESWRDRIGNYSGQPVPYCASEQFTGSGIRPGDRLYVLAFSEKREHLLLIGRLEVAARSEILAGGSPEDPLLTRDEALDVIGPEAHGVPLYGDDDDRYVIPRDGTGTPMRFDRTVPDAERLRFGPPSKPRYLRYDKTGKIDQQAIRRLSQLANISAQRLDALLV